MAVSHSLPQLPYKPEKYSEIKDCWTPSGPKWKTRTFPA